MDPAIIFRDLFYLDKKKQSEYYEKLL